MNTEIIVALISATAVIISAIIAYRANVKVKALMLQHQVLSDESLKQKSIIQDREFKIATLDKILNLQSFNEIQDSVNRIFAKTKADRFLILIGVNGTTDFRLVSVIFEQHKNTQYKVNALIRYRDVEIDNNYRKLLRDTEREGTIDLNIKKMPNQLLKNFYTLENVKYSKMRFLNREHLDKKNDIVIFSSVATHIDEDWTELENTIIKTEYEGSIIHTIKTFSS